jgi:hypothetical protein
MGMNSQVMFIRNIETSVLLAGRHIAEFFPDPHDQEQRRNDNGSKHGGGTEEAGEKNS